jgi:hypothetical protein
MSVSAGPNLALRNLPNGVPNLAVPEGSPSLFLDFVNNQSELNLNNNKVTNSNVMSLITFTRASPATYTSVNGTIQTATTNAPRFNYDPITGYCKGLLIEAGITNLCLDSNVTTGNNGVALTTNATISPDGTANATLASVTSNLSNAYHIHPSWSNLSVVNNTPYTCSMYVKLGPATTSGWFVIICYSSPSTNGARAWFDVANGVIGTVQTNGTASNVSGTMTPVGNGWYRCSVSFQLNGTDTGFIIEIDLTNTNGQYQGNSLIGYSLYFWGVQIEASNGASSLVYTSGTTGTRSQDIAIISGTNFSQWYNYTQGTLFLSCDLNAIIPSTVSTFEICSSTTPDGYSTAFYPNRMEIDAPINGNYAGRVPYVSVSAATSVTYKHTISFSNTTTISALNGSLATSYSPGLPLNVPNKIVLGASRTNQYTLFGHLKHLAFYPVSLTSSSLQQVTT